MRACGSILQPTMVLREVKSYSTSTCPAQVETDVGLGVIKGLGNPIGTGALVCELIAAEMGTWLGLEIPPFAVIDVCDIEVQMTTRDGRWLGPMRPPLYFSSFMQGALDSAPEALLKKLERPADIARLVVFDTWMRNVDRHDPRHGVPEVNLDNLLYCKPKGRRRYTLVPIDHSHCLVEGDLADVGEINDAVTDRNIYGLFPEFIPFIDSESVAAAVARLATLDRTFVEDCVNHIPTAWPMSGGAKATLIDLICLRAAFVVETVATALVPDPRLPGIKWN